MNSKFRLDLKEEEGAFCVKVLRDRESPAQDIESRCRSPELKSNLEKEQTTRSTHSQKSREFPSAEKLFF